MGRYTNPASFSFTFLELRITGGSNFNGFTHLRRQTLSRRLVAYSRPRAGRSRRGRAVNWQASNRPTTGGQQAVDTPVHRGPIAGRLGQSKSLINAINIT